MRYIGLMVVPGPGHKSAKVEDGDTVATFVARENLFGRTITLDGIEIAPTAFATTSMSSVREVWANGSSKNA